MGQLSRDAKARAASMLVTQRSLYVGLATARRDDGALVEEADPAYRRQPVVFGAAQDGDGGYVFVANDRRLDFPAYEHDAKADLRWWFLVDVAYEGAGDVVAWGELVPRFVEGDGTEHFPRPLAGEAPFLMPGDVAVGIGDAEEAA